MVAHVKSSSKRCPRAPRDQVPRGPGEEEQRAGSEHQRRRQRGLRGAKGLDVSDNLAVVAGSMDNAVVLFARHPNGTLSYLDSTFVGLRSVPSFHTAFNPKSLAPLSPLYKVSFTGEPSSILQGTLAQPSSHPPSNPPGDPSTSALPVSDGPARLELHEPLLRLLRSA